MTALEELEHLRLQIINMARRVQGEQELVTLDTGPVYRKSVDNLQNACIELNRALSQRHRHLLNQSYQGTTAEQAIGARIVAIITPSPAPVPLQSVVPHEQVLRDIDETP